jgi:PhoPQ-activated pathogenicity-related protein
VCCQDVIAVSELCVASGLPAVIVFNVPNEPITFPSDPLAQRRSEDAIIAFTWAHFLSNMVRPPDLFIAFSC